MSEFDEAASLARAEALDLNAVKQRADAFAEVDYIGELGGQIAAESANDVPALVDEVHRLRERAEKAEARITAALNIVSLGIPVSPSALRAALSGDEPTEKPNLDPLPYECFYEFCNVPRHTSPGLQKTRFAPRPVDENGVPYSQTEEDYR